MFSIARKLFGDTNTKELNRLRPLVEKINNLDDEIKRLKDIDLKEKTVYFKKLISEGVSIDDILPEAFAVAREAAQRTIKMRHFDVQIIGGIVLHQGKIAEMATGEGKTLVATLPAYLNALTEKSVHIVTVNDYLAKRDRLWMGPVYEFLGLKVGLIQHDMNPEQRKEAYQSDVVYGTNNEFGFDYLRDNMGIAPEEIVQHEHAFAIIDEVDSILIDEARTPLIISGPTDESTSKYFQIDKLIYRLKEEQDYKINEKEKTVYLTEEGVARMEKLLGVDNLYAQNNVHLQHHINQALKAHRLFRRDVDYVVKNGEVII
ncbi:MAG: preprotein translocase subunit SecA, partial [Bacteroidales bacterium]|nr:preprotein translocase subunit SecA [Bacteroidales bacterium]